MGLAAALGWPEMGFLLAEFQFTYLPQFLIGCFSGDGDRGNGIETDYKKYAVR
jgi:hypothetical protein